MDQESLRKLRLDRRLIGRRRWISERELEKELEALDDAADKQMPPEEADEEQPAPDDEQG